MKNKILISLICFLTSASLFAQDSTKAMPKAVLSTKMMTLQFGYSNMDNSVLKQFYVSAGEDLSQHYLTGGLSCYSEYNKWLTGITIQGGMSQRYTIRKYNSSTSDYQVSSNFGNLLLHVGYSVINKDRFKIYPILGIGAGRIALEVQSLDNFSTSQLTNPVVSGLEYTVSKYLAVFDIGLGFDYLLKAPKCSQEKEAGAILGIRAGYAQNIGIGSWRHNSGQITDNPAFNSGNIYVKANIGFYGKREKGSMRWKK